MFDSRFSTIDSLKQAYLNRETTPEEVATNLAERVNTVGRALNCFIAFSEDIEQQARKLQHLPPSAIEALPLYGVPFSVKDLIVTRDHPTTAGSQVQHPLRPPSGNAPVVKRLLQAGAILIGKTSLHEFAFGITNENEHFGPVLNPWDRSRMTGGSSGGSAAAVAADLGTFSLGTDTRGSIRIPSACCGTSGFKPTRGHISTQGVVPLSWTLDHVGPIARSVADLQRIMAVLGKPLPPIPLPSPDGNKPLAGLKVGYCDYYFRNIDPEVKQRTDEAFSLFKGEGAEIVELKIGVLDDALGASDHISRAEAVAFHDTFLTSQADRYGPAVRQRLMSGYDVTGLQLAKALRTREETIRQFASAFRRVHCLLAPTLPVVAPPLGTLTIGSEREPIVLNFVRLNAPQNVAGIPSISIPCGRNSEGLPIGLQIIGGARRDALVLEVAATYQALTGWHRERPPE